MTFEKKIIIDHSKVIKRKTLLKQDETWNCKEIHLVVTVTLSLISNVKKKKKGVKY